MGVRGQGEGGDLSAQRSCCTAYLDGLGLQITDRFYLFSLEIVLGMPIDSPRYRVLGD